MQRSPLRVSGIRFGIVISDEIIARSMGGFRFLLAHASSDPFFYYFVRVRIEGPKLHATASRRANFRPSIQLAFLGTTSHTGFKQILVHPQLRFVQRNFQFAHFPFQYFSNRLEWGSISWVTVNAVSDHFVKTLVLKKKKKEKCIPLKHYSFCKSPPCDHF